jgi:hypothetical protein
MQTNALPDCDMSVNTTGCCPKFNPQGWDAQELHFRDKPFVRATTRSLMHVPYAHLRSLRIAAENDGSASAA